MISACFAATQHFAVFIGLLCIVAQIGELMAQLLLPEAVRPEEVEAVTAQLVKARRS